MTDDDQLPDSSLDMTDLEREAGLLMRLRQFAGTLTEINWFVRLGEEPTQEVASFAKAYVEALGFPDAGLAILPDWEDAAGAAETFDWSSPAWEAEELLRAALTEKALQVLSDEALEVGLQLVARSAGEAVKAAMEEEAAYWDVEDESPRQLAVGAAAQASHGMALLLVAAAADPGLEVESHAFFFKWRLFEHGRWPVSIIGNSFSVF